MSLRVCFIACTLLGIASAQIGWPVQLNAPVPSAMGTMPNGIQQAAYAAFNPLGSSDQNMVAQNNMGMYETPQDFNPEVSTEVAGEPADPSEAESLLGNIGGGGSESTSESSETTDSEVAEKKCKVKCEAEKAAGDDVKVEKEAEAKKSEEVVGEKESHKEEVVPLKPVEESPAEKATEAASEPGAEVIVLKPDVEKGSKSTDDEATSEEGDSSEGPVLAANPVEEESKIENKINSQDSQIVKHEAESTVIQREIEKMRGTYHIMGQMQAASMKVLNETTQRLANEVVKEKAEAKMLRAKNLLRQLHHYANVSSSALAALTDEIGNLDIPTQGAAGNATSAAAAAPGVNSTAPAAAAPAAAAPAPAAAGNSTTTETVETENNPVAGNSSTLNEEFEEKRYDADDVGSGRLASLQASMKQLENEAESALSNPNK